MRYLQFGIHLIFGWLCFSAAYASSSLTVGDLAVNLTKQLPPYTTLLTGFAYIMGTVFIISGVLKIKQNKEMPNSVPFMAGPIFIIMGVFLIYLPSTTSYLYYSFFDSADSLTGMSLYYENTLMDGTSTKNT